MTEEEVAKILPSEEEVIEGSEEEKVFEVPSLTNFIQYFRKSYEMAIEEDNYYIESLLDVEGEGYVDKVLPRN